MKIIKVIVLALSMGVVSVNIVDGQTTHSPYVLPGEGTGRIVAGTDYIAGHTYEFDQSNRPYLMLMRSDAEFGRIQTIRKGAWVDINFRTAWDAWIAESTVPDYSPHVGYAQVSTSTIDADNSYYLVIFVTNGDASDRRESVLVYSPDITAENPIFKFYIFGAEGTGTGTHKTHAYLELHNSHNARIVTVNGVERTVTPAITALQPQRRPKRDSQHGCRLPGGSFVAAVRIE